LKTTSERRYRPSHRIDVHLLRYFLAVVEAGNITRAAESLYLAQPSLSQAIRGLERRIGAALFDRSVHPIRLTPAGERFVPVARGLLSDLDAARAAVHAVQELRTGRLRIATHAAFSVDPMIELISRFNAAHPHILIDILAAENSEAAKELVRRGTAELALGYGRVRAGGLSAIPLEPHEIVVAAVPGLIDSLPSPLPRSTASEIPLVLDTGDCGAESLLRRLGTDEKQPWVVATCTNPRALWGLVGRGSGAALLSRRVAEAYVPGTRTLSLDPPLFRTPTLFARSDHLSAAAEAFVRLATRNDEESGT